MTALSAAHAHHVHAQSQGIDLKKLCQDIHQSLKLWHDPSDQSPLDYLLLFQEAQRAHTTSNRRITNDLLLSALEALSHMHLESATLLRLRFLDNEPAYTAALKIGIAQSTVYRQQREAISKLAEIIHQEECKARAVRQNNLEERLNAPSYEALFGIDNQLNTLFEILDSPRFWLIGIEGIGGIGKTTLVDTAVRRLLFQGINLFEDFAWVSAQQQYFHLSGDIRSVTTQPSLTTHELIRNLAEQLLSDIPSEIFASPDKTLSILQKRLKDIPHLIVIDNLETVDELDILLPLLRRLANPTKFLLTSRQSLYAELGVYPFKVPELDRSSALELIRHSAQSNNLPGIASHREAKLGLIVDAVGGNPLALRLVVGQMYIQDFDVVLHNLQIAQGRSIEQLYTFIYRQAWDSLDDNARTVFLATPLLPEQGESMQFLLDTCALEPELFHDALNTLVTLNLINRHSHTGDQYSFSIHSLTKLFLAQQIIKWQP